MLTLPEKLRETLHEPFGEIVPGEKVIGRCKTAPRPLFSVGDQCTYDLLCAGVIPDVMVFDFKIKRKEISLEMKKVFAKHAANPYVVMSSAGVISDDLIVAVDRVLEQNSGAIFVVGEDDLSALLIMAYANMGTLVYGQPGSGAVLVELGTDEIKDKAEELLSEMENV